MGDVSLIATKASLEDVLPGAEAQVAATRTELEKSEAACIILLTNVSNVVKTLHDEKAKLDDLEVQYQAKLRLEELELNDLDGAELAALSSYDPSLEQKTSRTIAYLETYFEAVQQQKTLVRVLELLRGKVAGMLNQSDSVGSRVEVIKGIFTSMLESIHDQKLTGASAYREDDIKMNDVVVALAGSLQQIDAQYEQEQMHFLLSQAGARDAASDSNLRGLAKQPEKDARESLIASCDDTHGSVSIALPSSDDG